MVERLRDQHIRRLKDGVCSIDTGVVFLDVLNQPPQHSCSGNKGSLYLCLYQRCFKGDCFRNDKS